MQREGLTKQPISSMEAGKMRANMPNFLGVVEIGQISIVSGYGSLRWGSCSLKGSINH
jgi:hypothetical protein